MAFGFGGPKAKGDIPIPNTTIEDPGAWIVENDVSQFLLLHSHEVQFMCMFAYCFYYGNKIFSHSSSTDSMAYKFVRHAMASTGGGILVPIFINAIPFPLGKDAYMISIFCSFMIHEYFPIIRQVMNLSSLFKGFIVVLYECYRAHVVIELTSEAAHTIPKSQFLYAMFGPIACGTIGGIGGYFFPLDQGLSPIEKKGFSSSMLSAFLAATVFHLIVKTSLSDGIVNIDEKIHVHVSIFFISVGLVDALHLHASEQKKKKKKKKKEE